MRAKTIDGVVDEAIARRVGLKAAQIDEMYKIMAIANYEDRFVIPTRIANSAPMPTTCAVPAASRSATDAREARAKSICSARPA
jgi:nitrate reductase beta subunit